jgi:hypothetical protein
MSLWKKARRVIGQIARLAPLLRILGVKEKTVVGKIEKTVEEIDRAAD